MWGERVEAAMCGMREETLPPFLVRTVAVRIVRVLINSCAVVYRVRKL